MEIIAMAVGLIALGLAVLVWWSIRHDAKSEPDGNMSYPTCYGDYPKYSSQQLAERECWSCVYKQQCRERKEEA